MSVPSALLVDRGTQMLRVRPDSRATAPVIRELQPAPQRLAESVAGRPRPGFETTGKRAGHVPFGGHAGGRHRLSRIQVVPEAVSRLGDLVELHRHLVRTTQKMVLCSTTVSRVRQISIP